MNWIEFNHFCQFVGDCGFGTLPLPDRCLQVADPVALNWTAKGFGKRMFSERAARNVASLSRVENRRSGFSLPVAADEAFASSPQSGLAWLCFLFPLIGRVESRRAHGRRRWRPHRFRDGPHSDNHGHVSSSRHVKRSVRFSRTALSCLFRVTGYETYHAGRAFSVDNRRTL